MIRAMLKACRPWGMPQPQKTSSTSDGLDLGIALEQLVDHEGAKLVRAQLGERALEGPADGRADGVDDHCFGHLRLSFLERWTGGGMVRGREPATVA